MSDWRIGCDVCGSYAITDSDDCVCKSCLTRIYLVSPLPQEEKAALLARLLRRLEVAEKASGIVP